MDWPTVVTPSRARVSPSLSSCWHRRFRHLHRAHARVAFWCFPITDDLTLSSIPAEDLSRNLTDSSLAET